MVVKKRQDLVLPLPVLFVLIIIFGYFLFTTVIYFVNVVIPKYIIKAPQQAFGFTYMKPEKWILIPLDKDRFYLYIKINNVGFIDMTLWLNATGDEAVKNMYFVKENSNYKCYLVVVNKTLDSFGNMLGIKDGAIKVSGRSSFEIEGIVEGENCGGMSFGAYTYELVLNTRDEHLVYMRDKGKLKGYYDI